MKRRPVITLLFILTLFLSILDAEPAYAYLDPGTGSIILQGLLAGGAIVMAGAAYYWRRFLGFFRRDSKEPKSDSDPE